MPANTDCHTGSRTWEVARFDQMLVTVRTSSTARDVVVVICVDNQESEYSRFHDGFWAENQSASMAISKLRKWMKMLVPGTGTPARPVSILLDEQCEHACHGQPLEHIPSPLEIRAMYRTLSIKPRSTRMKSRDEYFAIESAQVHPDHSIEVHFSCGAIRIAPFRAKWLGDYWCRQIEAGGYDLIVERNLVAWKFPDAEQPEGYNTYEIESACLWGMSRLVASTRPELTYRASPAIELDVHQYPASRYFFVNERGYEILANMSLNMNKMRKD